MRKLYLIATLLTFVVGTVPFAAHAAGPDFFTPAIYADGEAFTTKGLSDLPAPNGKNNHSFDKLFSFVNGADGQLPVAEAAPGNPLYNGGRWDVQLATWAIPDPPVVTSYDEIAWYVSNGQLVTASAHRYFECPLLPLKR